MSISLPATGPRSRSRRLAAFLLVAVSITAGGGVRAASLDLPAPANSFGFGNDFALLPNGNIVVVDTEYSAIAPSAGAAYLYRPDGTLVSTLLGSTAYDRLGDEGITVLASGHYVIASPGWDDGGIVDAGAVTFGNADTGVSGTISAANSLVGTHPNDSVGDVLALRNGHYVVTSSSWDNDGIADVGAITWANGATGRTGAVTAANSLIGGAAGDRVGSGYMIALANGHAVVGSLHWNNGNQAQAGAVTWFDGTLGTVGVVSPANSLVGVTAGDSIGSRGLFELANGHYVVASPAWDNGTAIDGGAVTWCDGTQPTQGAVSPANSLVGAHANDQVGWVTPLANGNYVVSSGMWDLDGIGDAGAVTLVDGSAAHGAVMSASNSLHGTVESDRVGTRVYPLANGNYVVTSDTWDHGALRNRGAATWRSGTTVEGVAVSSANSLVGAGSADIAGDAVTPLANGNYVVRAPNWDNGTTSNVGAVVFGNGASGVAGVIGAGSALVGTQSGDRVGSGAVRALVNGHYAVGSPNWQNGALVDAGAATWGDGNTGTVGVVGTTNSWVGASEGDGVGADIAALTDGAYAVISPRWRRGALTDVGAVTRVPGTGPTAGVVGIANSLVGTRQGDGLTIDVTPLAGGGYFATLQWLDTATALDAGAVVLVPAGGLSGDIPLARAVFGTITPGSLVARYDASPARLVVAHAPANRVALLTSPADAVFANGFE